jgi:hypothetical protein
VPRKRPKKPPLRASETSSSETLEERVQASRSERSDPRSEVSSDITQQQTPPTRRLSSEGHERRQRLVVAGGSVFADKDKIKENLRNRMAKPVYNVADFYHRTGVFQYIARSNVFDRGTLVVICINAAWLSYDANENDMPDVWKSELQFIIAENIFCTYFAFELFIRFAAFSHKRNCLRDGWFLFDSAMAALMVAETWVMPLFFFLLASSASVAPGVLGLARLLRLCRMARLARLLRAIPELMILIKGMFAAMRAVCTTLSLLFVVLYVFGLTCKQVADKEGTGAFLFRNVQSSMFTLLIHGAFVDDMRDLATDLENEWVMSILFFLFVLIGHLTIMNMLIGVLVEEVHQVATTEEEERILFYVRDKLQAVMTQVDTDKGGTISKQEFVRLFESEEAMSCLNDVGVDVETLVDLADEIYEDAEDEMAENGLDFRKFMEIILELRGSNQARFKDVVELRKFIRSELLQVHHALRPESMQARSKQFVPVSYLEATQGAPKVDNPVADLQVVDATSTAEALNEIGRGVWEPLERTTRCDQPPCTNVKHDPVKVSAKVQCGIVDLDRHVLDERDSPSASATHAPLDERLCALAKGCIRQAGAAKLDGNPAIASGEEDLVEALRNLTQLVRAEQMPAAAVTVFSPPDFGMAPTAGLPVSSSSAATSLGSCQTCVAPYQASKEKLYILETAEIRILLASMGKILMTSLKRFDALCEEGNRFCRESI